MFNIAYAANAYQGSGFSGFIPMLVMGLVFALILMSIAPRKGKNKWLWFFAGFVPGWNFFGGIWLASLPDIKLYKEIAALSNVMRKHGLMSDEEEKTTSHEEIKKDTR
jgi:hypothetical protein